MSSPELLKFSDYNIYSVLKLPMCFYCAAHELSLTKILSTFSCTEFFWHEFQFKLWVLSQIIVLSRHKGAIKMCQGKAITTEITSLVSGRLSKYHIVNNVLLLVIFCIINVIFVPNVLSRTWNLRLNCIIQDCKQQLFYATPLRSMPTELQMLFGSFANITFCKLSWYYIIL